VQRPGELAALHPWTVPVPPVEDQSQGKDSAVDEDDAETPRSLQRVGDVGVPSMLALAQAVAKRKRAPDTLLTRVADQMSRT
jgi:hypothetical protein